MCLISWERTQKGDPTFSGEFRGQNWGSPNGPFSAIKSLVCYFFSCPWHSTRVVGHLHLSCQIAWKACISRVMRQVPNIGTVAGLFGKKPIKNHLKIRHWNSLHSFRRTPNQSWELTWSAGSLASWSLGPGPPPLTSSFNGIGVHQSKNWLKRGTGRILQGDLYLSHTPALPHRQSKWPYPLVDYPLTSLG